MSVREQTKILDINRSSLYYKLMKVKKDDFKIMRLIDEQYLKTPFYGTRKMNVMLKKKGFKVNRKRVQRLMKIMGIEAIYPKKNLSRRNHDHKIYPYLLRDISIDHSNQVWCTDITYLPMKNGFVYLVAILDWYSRRVISWRIGTTLDTSFCIDALEEALRCGKPEIFNTDQGCQFTSDAFTSMLKKNDIRISMDGKGRAIDNIIVERFWRSLKYEKIYLNEFSTIEEIKNAVREYIVFYNSERFHETLEYNTPDEVYREEAA